MDWWVGCPAGVWGLKTVGSSEKETHNVKIWLIKILTRSSKWRKIIIKWGDRQIFGIGLQCILDFNIQWMVGGFKDCGWLRVLQAALELEVVPFCRWSKWTDGSIFCGAVASKIENGTFYSDMLESSKGWSCLRGMFSSRIGEWEHWALISKVHASNHTLCGISLCWEHIFYDSLSWWMFNADGWFCPPKYDQWKHIFHWQDIQSSPWGMPCPRVVRNLLEFMHKHMYAATFEHWVQYAPVTPHNEPNMSPL